MYCALKWPDRRHYKNLSWLFGVDRKICSRVTAQPPQKAWEQLKEKIAEVDQGWGLPTPFATSCSSKDVLFVSSSYETPSYKYYLSHIMEKRLQGFSNRSDSKQPAQLQKLARILKLWTEQVYISYYQRSEQQRCWSDCTDAQADLHLCSLHMA